MSKHTLDDSSSLKHDKKRRKKDRKDAVKYEDITPPSTDVTANASPAPDDADDDAQGYKQNEELTRLPQAEIDSYLKTENVQITDPKSSGLRPVLAFNQLPSSILSTFSPALSKFSKPSSIQSSAWPHLLSSRDVVGIAETGSGKTLAFGLPLVHRLSLLKKKKGIRAVVVAPTRELAIQVFEQIDAVAKLLSKLKAACIYGGTNKDEQRRSLNGTNIIVATPGRLKDFMSDGTIDVSKTRYLVLDEADRMLDKGFEDDIKHIISTMPSSSKRQTAMFTATWPKSIRELASTFMSDPVRIAIGRNSSTQEGAPDDIDNDNGELRANPKIKQTVEVMDGTEKSSRLLQLLRQQPKTDKILVFCLYKKEATRIENLIRANRYAVAGIHGDLAQAAREKSLHAFKSGQVNILVATDVAARGLDIPDVRLVINVTFPLTAEDYVHRIGRTGRAGKDGTSITFFTEQDKGLAGGLVNVLKGAGQPVPANLLKFGTTVKKKQHEAYGAFGPKDDLEGKVATKVTFDD